MKKAIVLYYSFEGSTKKVAKYLAEHLDIDIHEIKPVKEIPTKSFIKYIWGGGQVVMKSKPAIEELKLSLDDYDMIFLGTPIWAGTFAPPIHSLLEKKFMANKSIAYFYCHEGGASRAENAAKVAIEKNNQYLGAFGCLNIKKNFESIKVDLLAWAMKIVDQK